MEISSIDANPVGRGRGNVRRTAPFVRVGDASSTTVSKQGAQADNTLRVGRGRGNVYSSRSRVSWSGDASRLLTRIGPTPNLSVQPVTTIKSNAWRQLEHQIFGGEAVLGQSGGTSYLLDSSDTAGSLVNMQWEPEERSCYMKLKNMLNGFNSRGFGEFKGRSFTATAIGEAEKWLLAKDLPPQPPHITVQDAAFQRFSRHKNSTVLRSACRFFQLPGYRYRSAVHQMAQAGEFKQACDCACALGLYDAFDARIFCLPLLLEERLTTAEAYLEHSPQAIRGLMRLLDELTEPSTNSELISGLVAAYPQLDSKLNVVISAADKLSGKPLDRLIRRYAERFGLQLAADMPKFAWQAAQKDLHFWIREFYEGGSKQLTQTCWRDLLERKVTAVPELQQELVDTLLRWDRDRVLDSDLLEIFYPDPDL